MHRRRWVGGSKLGRVCWGALGAIGAVLAGCGAPPQTGELVFAPGAEERALIAMRMGYLGFDREAVPGQVRRVMFADQLPERSGTGKLGDWVLENGHIVATISAVDGTPRGGRLIDFASKPSLKDNLDAVELRVLGHEVVYDSIVTGFDDTTSGAYVEVSGRVEHQPESGEGVTLAVSTRFDVGPGLSLLVVHTHIKIVRGAVDPASETPLLSERVRANDGNRHVIDVNGSYAATFSGDASTLAPSDMGVCPHASAAAGRGGYLQRTIGDVATLREVDGVPTFTVPASALAAEGEALVISRVISLLDRADSASLGVALAQAEGRDTGEIEIRIAPALNNVGPRAADLTFVPVSGEPLVVCGARVTGEDSHFSARLPAGQYSIVAHASSHAGNTSTAEAARKSTSSRGERVTIEPDRIAFVTLAPLETPAPEPAAGPPP